MALFRKNRGGIVVEFKKKVRYGKIVNTKRSQRVASGKSKYDIPMDPHELYSSLQTRSWSKIQALRGREMAPEAQKKGQGQL